jgi:hypothetical protein
MRQTFAVPTGKGAARPLGFGDTCVVAAVDELERGRESYARRAWMNAYMSLSRADGVAPLEAEDLELLATSAYMLGHDEAVLSGLERAHHAYLEDGKALPAARCAFWLGINLAMRGEMSPSTGWFSRAQRLLEREGRDCVEQGYLLIPVLLRHVAAGDAEAAYATAADAAAIGERFGDADLLAMAVHEQGFALVRQGRVEEGLWLLDETMVAVTAGELSPIVTGLVYCNVIAGCQEIYEARRAQEWTAALTRWCEQQPEMVAHTGLCLLHRAEIMQLHGAWPDAFEEARRASERFAQRAEGMNRPAVAQAVYRQGRSIACAGTSPPPRRRTGRQAGAAGSHNRVWPCCGWPRGTTTPRPQRSAAWRARPATR